MPDVQEITLVIPEAFMELFAPHRYKIFHGGRGGAKSWSVARVLLSIALQSRKRIVCGREFQVSIRDSVHALLKEQIRALGMSDRYRVLDTEIRASNGSQFVFLGLKQNIQSTKSFEGADILWIEEGQTTSKESLDIIIPTIRKEGSEIWITLNLEEDSDPVNTRFIVDPPPGAYVRKVNFDENPFMSKTLESVRKEALQLISDAVTDEARAQAQADYDHVWLGFPKRLAGSAILTRVVVEDFETPVGARFFHGADWGFAADPTVLTRSFIVGKRLFVDREAYGHSVELDEIPALFNKVETARTWPIKADSSRPETISHVKGQGFNISAADKWPGSVEDGIAHLNAFERIVVHKTNCPKTAEEARMYRYKVDRMTQEILPIIVDKWNHCWDGIRYGLDGYIQRRGGVGLWEKLGK